MSEESPAIDLRDLRVGYGTTEVLHGLSTQFRSGAWEVLLGPNGSGKTTLLKTLMGQIKPFGGQALILDRDCHGCSLELKRDVGYLPEDMYLYHELSPRQHLRFAGDMHEIPVTDLRQRAEYLLDLFELEEYADRPVKECSLGTKRKTGLCMALIHRPRVLLLDEPMNGLDPQAAETVRKMLSLLCSEENLSLLMSTHNLGMLHHYCNSLIIFYRGTILLKSPPDLLAEQHPGLSLEEIFLKAIREAAEQNVSADTEGASEA